MNDFPAPRWSCNYAAIESARLDLDCPKLIGPGWYVREHDWLFLEMLPKDRNSKFNFQPVKVSIWTGDPRPAISRWASALKSAPIHKIPERRKSR